LSHFDKQKTGAGMPSINLPMEVSPVIIISFFSTPVKRERKGSKVRGTYRKVLKWYFYQKIHFLSPSDFNSMFVSSLIPDWQNLALQILSKGCFL